MPYIPHSPEASLQRSDSKDPTLTCAGITDSGRYCRRAVAARRLYRGTFADGHGAAADASAFCWQHKDQAYARAVRDGSVVGSVEDEGLQQRTSIDTILDRLGVLSVADEGEARDVRREWQGDGKNSQRMQSREDEGTGFRRGIGNRRESAARGQGASIGLERKEKRSSIGPVDARVSSRREAEIEERTDYTMVQPVPPAHQSRPLPPSHAAAVPVRDGERPPRRRSTYDSSRHSSKKRSGFLSFLCCMDTIDEEDDYMEVVRHRRRPEKSRPLKPASRSAPEMRYARRQDVSPDLDATRPPPAARAKPKSTPTLRAAAVPVMPATIPTPRPVELICPSLPAETRSLLQEELAKPISSNDEEGYIYMFWVTPREPSSPALASSLLHASRDTPSSRSRSADAAQQISAEGLLTSGDSDATARKTITLKIGRTNNVQRRLSSWSRQCGYALSLIRFYPYVPSGASPSLSPRGKPISSTGASSSSFGVSTRPPSPQRLRSDGGGAVRKVPCSHRVERLIHIELAAQRADQGRCSACGRAHREWFEVEASREGLGAVDEVVRRWIAWAEQSHGSCA